ncbi:MAG TPA: DEAD/DEAH box helicase, partial [Candidatus Nanoarchaeia archaeon]|nr:DEAD/DEAH box helicase [Candidatus Nanoarchaeia archaeon]
MEKFRKLGLIEPIIKSIQEQEFTEPSEIQEKTIPLILEGKDVIAGAATGSGKTLAFASGIIKNVDSGKGIQALVLTPTRELANQVAGAIYKFSEYKELDVCSIYGGVSLNPQINQLRRADVVVGTPGRILDHLGRRTIDLRKVKILVLDEADRMLDMGFLRDVARIISSCPTNRQTLLFSATISHGVFQLAKKYMKEPIEIAAESYVDPTKLKQVFYEVEPSEKFSLLLHFLKNEKAGSVMVFCNTKRTTDVVARNLNEFGVEALAIHGGYSQEKRNRTMQNFHAKNVLVMVCTDVAARGLDIKGVSHIYNYESPKDSKEYIHRIGRTARAGKEGKVVNIIAQSDYENFRKILYNSEIKISREENPEFERVRANFRPQYTIRRRFSQNRRPGRRDSRGDSR